MTKNSTFDQFSGPGKEYAPKPAPRAVKPPVPFAPEHTQPAPSAEDAMRDTVLHERAGVKPINRSNQSTDHMQ